MIYSGDQARRSIAEFYDGRAKFLGPSIRALGWSSVSSQTLRFERLMRLADVTEKRVLDVGCGSGDLAKFLAQSSNDFEYVGIDVSETLIDWAKEANTHQQVSFLVADYDEHAFDDFDLIVQSGAATLRVNNDCSRAIRMTSKMLLEAKLRVAGNFLQTRGAQQASKNCYFTPDEILSALDLAGWRSEIDAEYELDEFTLHFVKETSEEAHS